MNNLCIIPAGGSKRIPIKNIKPFFGNSTVAYSIETSLKSKLVDEVMVSTKDSRIVKVAKEYGAKVLFLRSEEKADVFSTNMDVLKEVVSN